MKFQLIFGGIFLIILGAILADGFKIPSKSGWVEPTGYMIGFYLLLGVIYLIFGVLNKPKHSDFFRCKKCKKVYNFSDTKDMICPKCGGKLQDYAEFEKEQEKEKQDEFKEAEKFQEEWIKQIKEERKKK
ncbi:zinc ribbon domain-containing protein [Campylobacter sp. JMF_02 ED1]|uniref:zinc ribbon domain-containing protein n=1 Tax=unclassified Campylobacter TaxID=2593542 RepID=UPI0022E9F841|nr:MULTISPECIES: zinc ribbon domain-containing protein [unclassified Campylobacter]MDA3049453.1 zinc ribbon domain-containing protein [Campylobacter sp. JMF_15 NE4]MDA3051119.1 zinc ribbon domain-containing protein [Campylobacter sp. JMF_02 ED1]